MANQEIKTLKDGTLIDPRNSIFPARPQNEASLSLWNDPRWKRAAESMSEDQLNHYKTIGNQMNGSINYETGDSNAIPIPEPAQESIAYITMALRSGLDPHDLAEEEIETMKNLLGNEWDKVLLSMVKNKNNDNDKN